MATAAVLLMPVPYLSGQKFYFWKKGFVEQLELHIEGLIFAADHPISIQEIKTCLSAVFDTLMSEEETAGVIRQLQQKYRAGNFAFEIVEIGEGYQFMTKPAFHHSVGEYLKIKTRKRLSRAALETLSIIAYKQPVTKSELEKIRGVSCDYSIQKLLENDLIAIAGRSEGPGRPLLYGTSEKFMDYFGLRSMNDLPRLKDFQIPDDTIGEQAPIEEEDEPEEN